MKTESEMSAHSRNESSLPSRAGESLLDIEALLHGFANRILKMTPVSKRESHGQVQAPFQEVARSAGGQRVLSVAGDSGCCFGRGAVRGQGRDGHGRFRA